MIGKRTNPGDVIQAEDSVSAIPPKVSNATFKDAAVPSNAPRSGSRRRFLGGVSGMENRGRKTRDRRDVS